PVSTGMRAPRSRFSRRRVPTQPSPLAPALEVSVLRPVTILVAGMSLATLAFGSSALAAVECTKEKPCILRVRTVAPAASPWGQLLNKVSADIQAESQGRIDVKIYWTSKSEPAAVTQC